MAEWEGKDQAVTSMLTEAYASAVQRGAGHTGGGRSVKEHEEVEVPPAKLSLCAVIDRRG